MLIRSNGGADFQALARKLRAAGADGRGLRRDLTQAFQTKLKPVVSDVQDAIRHLQVKGTKGRGSLSRERFAAAADLRRISKAQAAGRRARARRRAAHPTGLRATIARLVKSRVQWSGIRYGVRVYVDASGLPQKQRRLPQHLDNPGGWRHPVWGHRDRWVGQAGNPWFMVTVKRHEADMKRFVIATVSESLRKLR